MTNVPLDRFLSYRVNRLSEAVAEIVSQVYEREVNLSLRELRVLRTVGSSPAIAHGEIVERVLFEKSLVSRLISGLVSKSYLKRQMHKTDARRTSMILTRTGAEILKKADTLGLAMDKVWLSALSSREQKMFNECIEKLTRGLGPLARRFDVS